MRAYDARTGCHRWDFHLVRQSADACGADTWADEAWCYSGNTNVRGNIAAGPGAGLSRIEPVGQSEYDGEVITDGIRAFMARDWQGARDAKDAYWTERVGRFGPSEALRIADELRRQALLQHPEWPDAASRRDDLSHHVRMTELFARVDAARDA